MAPGAPGAPPNIITIIINTMCIRIGIFFIIIISSISAHIIIIISSNNNNNSGRPGTPARGERLGDFGPALHIYIYITLSLSLYIYIYIYIFCGRSTSVRRASAKEGLPRRRSLARGTEPLHFADAIVGSGFFLRTLQEGSFFSHEGSRADVDDADNTSDKSLYNIYTQLLCI